MRIMLTMIHAKACSMPTPPRSKGPDPVSQIKTCSGISAGVLKVPEWDMASTYGSGCTRAQRLRAYAVQHGTWTNVYILPLSDEYICIHSSERGRISL